MHRFQSCHLKESYLIFIISRIQITLFTKIIKKKTYRQLYFETFDNAKDRLTRQITRYMWISKKS